MENLKTPREKSSAGVSRRNFLKIAGATGVAGAFFGIIGKNAFAEISKTDRLPHVGGTEIIENDYWIEASGITEVPVRSEGKKLAVAIKSWGTGEDEESLSGIAVRVEFLETGKIEENYTDAEGNVRFFVPRCDEETTKNVSVSLCDFPEIKKSLAISYVQNIKYYGATHTAAESICGEDDYLAETRPSSNIALVESPSVEGDIARITKAARAKIFSVLAVSDIFFEAEYENGSLADINLRPDYLERWLNYANEIEPFRDSIMGFFTMDEPFWHAINCGKSFEEMRAMIEESAFRIKKSFPDKKVIGSIYITERELSRCNADRISANESEFTPPDDAHENYAIPNNYDLVGIYYYWSAFKISYPNGTLDQFVEIWGERLKSFDKHLHPHQKIILIPGTFCFAGQDVNEIEQELITLAPMYQRFAENNAKITAVMPFLYPSNKNLVGMNEMPKLKKKWESIGEEILANNGQTRLPTPNRQKIMPRPR